ncbi:MAG: response regulator, partial [Micropruina sp.]|nr:response regulator [Micropruina sp.]
MAADPYRALVIEDDPDLAHLTGMILENGAGMSTALACDAITALELLERDRFDVVISDIQMPGRSGLELLPEIHRLAPGVPVIFLTAHAKLDYAVQALRGGANEFLAKPI